MSAPSFVVDSTSTTTSMGSTPTTSTAASRTTQPDSAVALASTSASRSSPTTADPASAYDRKLGERLIVRELFALSDAAAAHERAVREAATIALQREEQQRRDGENLAALMELRAQHPVGPPAPDPRVASWDTHDAGWRRVYAAVVKGFPELGEEDRRDALLWLQNDFRLIESRLYGEAVLEAKANLVHLRFRDVRARKERVATERKIREESEAMERKLGERRMEMKRAEEIKRKEEQIRRREGEKRKRWEEKKRSLNEEPDVLGGTVFGVLVGMLAVASVWCWMV